MKVLEILYVSYVLNINEQQFLCLHFKFSILQPILFHSLRKIALQYVIEDFSFLLFHQPILKDISAVLLHAIYARLQPTFDSNYFTSG